MGFIEEILKEAENDETLRGTRIVSRLVGYIEITDKNSKLDFDESYIKVLQLTKLIQEN